MKLEIFEFKTEGTKRVLDDKKCIFTFSQPPKVIINSHNLTHFAWNMYEGVLTLIPFDECCDVAYSCSFLIFCRCKNLLYSVWLGVINTPAVALGMFSGGVVMKRYKLGIMGTAKFAFGTSLLGYFLSLFFLAMGCENAKVAGITVSYSRYVISNVHTHISFMCLYQKQRLGFEKFYS